MESLIQSLRYPVFVPKRTQCKYRMLIYLGYCVYIYNIRTLSGDIQFICTSYIKQVEKRVLCELFWPVSQRVQKKVQKAVKWFETSRTNYQLNRF